MKKILYFTIVALTCTACGNLSRGKAKDEIIKYYKLPYKETIQFSKKFYNGHEFQGGLETMCMQIGGVSYVDYAKQLDKLVNKGYITLSDSYDDHCNDKYIDVTLTEKGKKDMVADTAGMYTIRYSTIEFGEITGIVEYKELKAADVSYTLERTDISEFGDLAKKNESI